MGLVTALIAFVLRVLVGGLAIQTVSTFFGWIPLLGPLLSLVAYVAVIKVAYDVEWLAAGAIALVAWLTLLVVSMLLAPLALLGI